MRRTVSILAAAAMALGGTRSAKSLNDEWISLVNSGAKAVNSAHPGGPPYPRAGVRRRRQSRAAA